MANQLEQQLVEAGKKLLHPPHSKDALLKILKHLANYLSEVDQSPSQMMWKAMHPAMNALVAPELLGHRDKDVTLLVATCISEITRITAPDAPYSDDVLKDIFHLIVGTFWGLDELNNPSFGRRVTILETVAKIRSCVVMLDLECDDLIIEMFHIFFSVASEAHPDNVLKAMQNIMTLILDESEDISEKLLAIVFASLGRKQRDVSPAARRLAMEVLEQCAIRLEPYVYDFITSAMSNEGNSENDFDSHYNDIIYDIYQCAPQMLQRIIPNMKEQLLADQLDVRLNAVKLLGRLFAIPGHPLPEVFQLLFSEFLKRSSDKAVEVRLSVVEHAKECLLSNPFRHEAADIISVLRDRLLDHDENVRKQAVAAICDVANYALKSIPMETIRHVADRLRDKAVSVRMYTLDRLAEIYRVYCSKCSDGLISDYEFEWIPQKIIRCCYDKNLRPQAIELVLSESLFPTDLSVVERVKHWILMYSTFEKCEMKALEGVLAQKQRLQQEMQSYLSLRQKMKEDNAFEFEKKILSYFKTMSLSFKDPSKAETSFQKLNQLKDSTIWKALTSLLDPSKTFSQAQAIYIDMIERLGDKHPQHDFIKELGAKCSYRLFSKEHLKEMLKEITVNKVAGRDELVKSIMNLLVLFAGFFPCLVQGSEEDLLELLKGDNECIKEGVVHILAKAGGSIGEQMTDSTSSVDLLLETLCLEGNRKQAKYAVQALAAITEDAGLKALSVLYKRLVDMLESWTHLPAILQSLGCIAQNAMPVFETREEDVIHFVCDKLLRQNSNPADISKTEWEDRSEECLLKIYGLKTLVKSYLPRKDSHLRQRIEDLLGVLARVLTYGEISENVKSSQVDKAHMRLTAAKSLLQLSRHWDHQITPELFHLTLRIAQDTYPEVRREFLGKVHQYLKERTLDQKYACAFVLGISSVNDDTVVEVKRYLVDFVEVYHRDAQLRQPYAHSDGKLVAACPEYILAYLVHALAHNPEFPAITGDLSAEAFEPLYLQLYFFLSVFVHRDDDDEHSDSGIKREQESFAIIMTIFQRIKQAEDAVDNSKSENLYVLCDIGLSITKELIQKMVPPSDHRVSVSLPSVLYKPLEESKDIDQKERARDFTSRLVDSGVLAHFQALSMHGESYFNADQMSNNRINENVTKESEMDELDEPLKKVIRSVKLQGIKKQSSSEGRKFVNSPKHLKVCDNKDSKSLLEVVVQAHQVSKNQENFKLSGEVANGMEGTIDSAPKQGIIDDTVSNDTETLALSKRKRGRPGKDTQDFIVSEPCQPKHGRQKGSGKRSHAKEDGDLEGLTMEKANILSSNMNGEEKCYESSTNKKLELSKDPPVSASGLDTNTNHSPKIAQKSVPAIQKSSRKDESPELSQSVQFDKKKLAAMPKSAVRVPTDSLKGRGTYRKPLKKKSLSGLQKSTEKVKQQNIDYEKLVGLRIKVWWPLDKQFYDGIVQSYDPVKKKHRILYDDGDIEVLRLQKERWELIASDLLPGKLTLSSLESEKITNSMPGKETSHRSDVEGKKPQSSHKRKASFPKSSKKGNSQSRLKTDNNGVSATRIELDSSGVKAGDPFLSMDDRKQPASGKRGKGKSGSGGGKGGRFSISTKITSGTGKDLKKASTRADDDKKGSVSDSASRDSDDEPLNAWWSRMRKMR